MLRADSLSPTMITDHRLEQKYLLSKSPRLVLKLDFKMHSVYLLIGHAQRNSGRCSVESVGRLSFNRPVGAYNETETELRTVWLLLQYIVRSRTFV